MTLLGALSVFYVAVGIGATVCACLVPAAIKRADNGRVRGRLAACEQIFVGLLLGCAGRAANELWFVLIGLLFLFCGCLTFMWFLPAHGADGGDGSGEGHE